MRDVPQSAANQPHRYHRFITIALSALALYGLQGCVTKKDNLITISSPKVYTDDRVLRVLDERKKALSEVVKTIQEKDLQEISGVRQASKTTIVLKGQATADPVVAAPEAIESQEISLPTAPAPSDKLGLPFQSLLRKVALRDQLIMGFQLLYAGDNDFLDPARRVILVRFDVSINEYIEGKSSLLSDIQFVTLGFKLTSDKDADALTKPRVYAVMPDYSSIVTMDSFVNSEVQRLLVQAAGKTGTTALQGALDSQRALEESLLSVVEQPMQFAMYGVNTVDFGYAFGPRRRVEKRSWINPLSWFGNRYTINYQIEPGPRDVYALISFPCDTKKLQVEVRRSNQPTTTEFHNILETEAKSTSSAALSPPAISILPQPADNCTKPTITETADHKGLLAEPPHFYPKQGNSMLLISDSPVSTETEVWLNHVLLPREQISVLGRYRLKITVPPNDSLKALLKEKDPTLTVRVVTPGLPEGPLAASRFYKGILLKDTDAIEPTFDLDPQQGAAGTDVKMVAKNTTLNFAKTTEVSVGGVKADLIVGQTKEKQVIFRIPKPSNETVDHPVSVEIVITDGAKTERVYLNNKFTYLAPKK